MNSKHFDNGCYGHCPNCGITHHLEVGDSLAYAQSLMFQMMEEGRIDIDVPLAKRDPRLSLSSLFPGDRGHMFGVLQCRDKNEQTVWLKAFSSLRGGIRFVPGWVEPNLSQAFYDEIVDPEEARIKRISNEWSKANCHVEKARLAKDRATLSQRLWHKMKSRYRFYNAAGQVRDIPTLFGDLGVPGGVGECCAPKLLCAAAKTGLTPIGLCEFYWAPNGNRDEKVSGQFYPCCDARCRPILGFLLCGTEKKFR